MNHQFLISICIPTFNRAFYLNNSLNQISSELKNISKGLVEICIFDNCSSDLTEEVVAKAMQNGLSLRYIRNDKNIGSDENIAQCFNQALGKYILIMGDDDLFIDGALIELIKYLQSTEYGLVFLKPFGFDNNFRMELPYSIYRTTEYTNSNDFLVKVGCYISLISACIINKSLLTEIDARQFCGNNLVQVHLCVMAVLRANKNLYIHHYQVAIKRNNSSGYDHSRIFVKNLLNIFDSFVGKGLTKKDIQKIERDLLLFYLPYYILRILFIKNCDLQEIEKNYNDRYDGKWFYIFGIRIAFYLPRFLAIAWVAFLTLVGRILCGDFIRGLYFLKNYIYRINFFLYNNIKFF